jgi:uncharacterized protein
MSATNIAKLLHLNEWQVNNVITLLQKDATIPFIARYRKEKTGDLDEVQLRSIEEEYDRLQELEKRRKFILSQIEELGKLTPELKKALLEAENSEKLEDLYLPYKSRRKTKASYLCPKRRPVVAYLEKFGKRCFYWIRQSIDSIKRYFGRMD